MTTELHDKKMKSFLKEIEDKLKLKLDINDHNDSLQSMEEAFDE